ncbi:MAG: DUF3467 domain-containing protein [Brevinematales bacterium]|jgi:hypothetical protein
MDKQINNKPTGVPVKFQDTANKVSYSNFALINNSSEEFLLDFGTITPGREGVEVFSRIALSPRNARLFLNGLAERVKKFEEQYGPIKPPEAVELDAMNVKK